MFRRTHIVAILVPALLAALAQPPGASAYGPRSEALTVRDVQRIVSDLLAQNATAFGTDINNDGCVDIRDLQRALSLADEAEGPEVPRDPAPKFSATPVQGPRLPVSATPLRYTQSILDREPHTTARPVIGRERVPIPREVLGKLSMLYPNAPPDAAWRRNVTRA